MGLLYVASGRSRLPAAEHVWDKLAHAGAYGALSLACVRALHGGLGRLRRGPALGALLLTIGYGAVDEWHQGFVPGRHPELADWAADLVGALGGLAAAWVHSRLTHRGRLPGARGRGRHEEGG